MDFTIPAHFQNGVLNEEDLKFFYYCIGLENQQGWPVVYEWDDVVKEFNTKIDIEACENDKIPDNCNENTIRFSIGDDDKNSKAMSFFRHLRNAFSHYRITREGDDYVFMDKNDNNKKTTMRGKVNAYIFKEFCFRFFDLRDEMIEKNTPSKEDNI